MTGPHAITAYTAGRALHCPGGHHERGRRDAGWDHGSGLGHLDLRTESGADAANGHDQSVAADPGQRDGDHRQLSAAAVICFPIADQRAASGELVDGNYTLLVQQTGQTDVPGTLTVSRDAPGVFTQTNTQQLPLVLALHQDGTMVTFDSPAIQGETISLYGTGFGPYTSTVVDGFFVPATPPIGVSDPVILNVGILVENPFSPAPLPGWSG